MPAIQAPILEDAVVRGFSELGRDTVAYAPQEEDVTILFDAPDPNNAIYDVAYLPVKSDKLEQIFSRLSQRDSAAVVDTSAFILLGSNIGKLHDAGVRLYSLPDVGTELSKAETRNSDPGIQALQTELKGIKLAAYSLLDNKSMVLDPFKTTQPMGKIGQVVRVEDKVLEAFTPALSKVMAAEYIFDHIYEIAGFLLSVMQLARREAIDPEVFLGKMISLNAGSSDEATALNKQLTGIEGANIFSEGIKGYRTRFRQKAEMINRLNSRVNLDHEALTSNESAFDANFGMPYRKTFYNICRDILVSFDEGNNTARTMVEIIKEYGKKPAATDRRLVLLSYAVPLDTVRCDVSSSGNMEPNEHKQPDQRFFVERSNPRNRYVLALDSDIRQLIALRQATTVKYDL